MVSAAAAATRRSTKVGGGGAHKLSAAAAHGSSPSFTSFPAHCVAALSFYPTSPKCSCLSSRSSFIRHVYPLHPIASVHCICPAHIICRTHNDSRKHRHPGNYIPNVHTYVHVRTSEIYEHVHTCHVRILVCLFGVCNYIVSMCVGALMRACPCAWLCVSVCVCMWLCLYVCACVCMCVYVCVYVGVCVCGSGRSKWQVLYFMQREENVR